MPRPLINPFDKELEEKKQQIEEISTSIEVVKSRLDKNPKEGIEKIELNIGRIEKDKASLIKTYQDKTSVLSSQVSHVNEDEKSIRNNLDIQNRELQFYTSIQNQIEQTKISIQDLNKQRNNLIADNKHIDEAVMKLTEELNTLGASDPLVEIRMINQMIKQLQNEQSSWFVSAARIEMIKNEMNDWNMRKDRINYIQDQIAKLVVEKTNNSMLIADIEERIPKQTKDLNIIIRQKMESKIKGLSDSDFQQMSNIVQYVNNHHASHQASIEKLKTQLSNIREQLSEMNTELNKLENAHQLNTTRVNSALDIENARLKSARFEYKENAIQREHNRNEDKKSLSKLEYDLADAQQKLKELEVQQKSYAEKSEKTISSHAKLFKKLDVDAKSRGDYLKQMEEKHKLEDKAEKVIKKSKDLGEHAAEKALSKHKKKRNSKGKEEVPSSERPKF